MHIGTPLSPSATRVMLLGSGELGKEIAIALQRLGVEVIAVDRYPNAPGHQVAHRAHVIAMTDAALLRRVVEQEHPQLIVPEIEGISTEALIAIEQAGLAEIVPNARAVQVTGNRETLRRFAAETLRLPTSPFRFAGDLPALVGAIEGDRDGSGIGYPCVVKPVLSWSGKGQSVVRQKEDVADAWQYAESSARVRGSHVMVEGFVPFDYEITLLVVRAAGEDGNVTTQFCAPIGHRQVEGAYVESWQPQPMAAATLARAQDMARRFTDALGGRGVYGVEMFVKGDEVWFSEASPRPHDTGMVTLCSQVQDEFALHARAILGLPVDVTLRGPGASAAIHGGVDARGIRYEDVAAALAVPHSDLRLFGKPEAYRRRRMGVALATGETVDEARARARECAARVHPRPATA